MLKFRNKCNNQGDTLIEVLFAITVFSLVVVGSLSIMNQGTATAQRSLEITLVRQQIDAQAEALRYLNASFIAGGSGSTDWRDIQILANENRNLGATNFNSTSCVIPNNIFILNTHTGRFVDTSDTLKPILASTYSQVIYGKDGDEKDKILKVEGIWIEPVSSVIANGNEANIGYIDFHIRACWDSPGQSFPVTLGTVVRLYEPR